MKTLTIALCLLLVLPASAQQIPPPRAPSFYVPYGIRDVPMDAIELESSSAETWVADPGQRRNTPMPRPYPVHRGRHRVFQRGYGLHPQQQDSTAVAVVGGVIAATLLIALATGDH